jgi:hypothetical protein
MNLPLSLSLSISSLPYFILFVVFSLICCKIHKYQRTFTINFKGESTTFRYYNLYKVKSDQK